MFGSFDKLLPMLNRYSKVITDPEKKNDDDNFLHYTTVENVIETNSFT